MHYFFGDTLYIDHRKPESWNIQEKKKLYTCNSISDGAQPKVLITCPNSTADMLPPPSLQVNKYFHFYSVLEEMEEIKNNRLFLYKIYLSKKENISWYSSSFSLDRLAVA